jgi:hypothetical protein
MAAEAGRCGGVELLLAAGVNLEAADLRGRTPLFVAAEAGKCGVVELLLAAGANLEAADLRGWTPLFVAAVERHLEVAQLLLAAGADVNAATTSGMTSLHEAAFSNHHALVQLLLSKGANPQLCNSQNCTALHTAAQRAYSEDNRDIVRLLLDALVQPRITVTDLVKAAQAAAHNVHTPSFALLVKELHKLYPGHMPQLFQAYSPVSAPDAVEAALKEWASDVSSMDGQRAAIQKRKEAVASERTNVQHMLVAVAGMAKCAEQDPSKSVRKCC